MKRIFDFVVSIIAFIFISPLLAAVASILYITQGGPVIFTQPRVGYKGKIFYLYKFRTMRAFKEGENPHGMERLTKFGKLIRSLSFDELPSLINIINGDMSLVGPRPLLTQYVDRYSEIEQKRHDVMPGLTGWAQVNGRNTLSWSSKFEYDVWYAQHANFWLDLKIIFLTFKTLIVREGISANGSDIMEEFDPGLYVFGSGGHAKVVISSIQAQGLKIMGVFDDNKEKHGKKVLGVPVLGTIQDSKNYKVKKAVIGIGSNIVREKLAKEYDYNWINVIHPSAIIHESVRFGKGTVVFAGAIIQPGAVIGDQVIINSGAIVDHDCTIGNYSHICPSSVLTGGVEVGEGCLIGTGTKIIPEKKVGHYSQIGAGSVVSKDIPEYSVAVGVPAEVIKTILSHKQRKQA